MREENRVGDLQCLDCIAFFRIDGESHLLTCCSSVHICCHFSEISIEDVHIELLGRCAFWFVSHLVDIHADGAWICDDECVAAYLHGNRNDSFQPIARACLLNSSVLAYSVDTHSHVTSLAAVGIADTDIILTSFSHFLLMTQSTARVCLHLHISHARKVLGVLCPPTRVGQFAVSTLGVHILSFDDDGTMVRFWLLGLRKSCGWQTFIST